MSVIRPPVTGDYVLDSFLNQLVSELSVASYTAANLEQNVLSIDSNSYSATLYLYIRTEDNELPTAVSSETTYNYVTGKLYVGGIEATKVDGWSFTTPPSISDGAYYWQCYVHISSDNMRETIAATSWSTPELVAADLTIDGIPVPSTPTNFTATYVTKDRVRFSWTYSEVDISHPGLYAELQSRVAVAAEETPNIWRAEAYLAGGKDSVELSGFKGVDNAQEYRVRTGNVISGLHSTWSSTKKVTPITPDKVTVTDVVYDAKLNAHKIWFSYPATALVEVQLFEIEQAFDNDIYEVVSTVSGKMTSAIITGVNSFSEVPKYRVRALGLNNRYGPYSDVTEDTVGIILTPSTPKSLTFLQNAKNVGSLSWNMDSVADIIHFEIEESVGDENNYTFVSTVQKVPNQLTYNYRRVGLASEDDTIYFRVRSVGLNRFTSSYTDAVDWIPGVPNTPSNLTYSRIDKENGLLTWEYNGNYSTVRNFIIEVREVGASTFETAASVDGEDYQYVIPGLSVRAKDFEYRVRAVSLYGAKSDASTTVTVSPSGVVAPTGLTLQAVENVGTITAVRLNWQAPADLYNQYSVVTAQLLHESDNDWKDVATVPAESTSVEFQPSRQGVLTFRVRATAVNGKVSGYSDTASIYISGGSATDTAIYNGDSSFLATRHYSVNTDDKSMTVAAEVDIESGGTYSSSTNKITGEANTDLTFYWYVNIPTNSVERQRHYYLNVDNVETVSSNPSPWTIDKGNVQVEVLTSSSDTPNFYLTGGTGDYIYIGSGQTSTDIRTYTDRLPNFMYAERTFISLTMKRTFTFRQSGATLVKITFKADANEIPVINLNSGNELKLEAYATELIDDYDDLSITNDATDPDGTLWEFDENFEVAPKIFITPNINTTTWVTDKTATSCRIHAVDDCTVDLTARGR